MAYEANSINYLFDNGIFILFEDENTINNELYHKVEIPRTLKFGKLEVYFTYSAHYAFFRDLLELLKKLDIDKLEAAFWYLTLLKMSDKYRINKSKYLIGNMLSGSKINDVIRISLTESLDCKAALRYHLTKNIEEVISYINEINEKMENTNES